MKIKTVQFITVLIAVLLFTEQLNAQNYSGFKKDSLQVKMYVHIKYENAKPKEIKVKKIFCDYCNESQKAYLAQTAWSKDYKVSNDRENVVENGLTTKALFIRVAKNEFRKL